MDPIDLTFLILLIIVAGMLTSLAFFLVATCIAYLETRRERKGGRRWLSWQRSRQQRQRAQEREGGSPRSSCVSISSLRTHTIPFPDSLTTRVGGR